MVIQYKQKYLTILPKRGDARKDANEKILKIKPTVMDDRPLSSACMKMKKWQNEIVSETAEYTAHLKSLG